MQLITYADRLGGDLGGLKRLLDSRLAAAFDGVHILPFFDPIDGADAGFDPSDHTRVDPRLGGWRDIAAIARDRRVMADLIVNHVSADSPEFADVRRRGAASEHWPLFMKLGDVFPDHMSDVDREGQVARIYRPRPGRPFTSIALDDGSVHEFWTTFSDKQLDIDVESAAGRAYLDRILDRFAEAGVREIRLDAAGYAIKRRGTTCFMLPETFDFISALSARAERLGISSLVEIHSHYQTQIDIATRAGRVYDFALPPLVLHTLFTGDSGALAHWLRMAPRNCVTVLDTHDGIGIRDVAGYAGRPGLLPDDAVDNLVETIHLKTGGDSRRASGHAASNLDVYQVNSTYYDALGRDDTAYLVARAIQFFSPGEPQVYYVGLLAGHNDNALVARTGVGRDINRHYYTEQEIDAALARPVVRDLFRLMRIRNEAAAFGGEFSVESEPAGTLRLRWQAGADSAVLHVDAAEPRATIDVTESGHTERLAIAAGGIAAAAA